MWRSETDDGTLIERLDGGSNGARDGEYWRATTTDGTKYYFGKTRRTGDTSNVTDSVSTVPVYGNQSGEPCHASTWAASRCTQAWRWNLDYVVDPHSNSMTLYYAQEKNRYGANKNTAWPEYDRGSVLKKIEYGTRTTSEGTTPPFRVVFTTAQRCLVKSGVTCATLDSSHAKDWPDVPFDQVCTSSTSCSNRWSPAFFSRLRLTTVDAQVRDAAGAYKTVDTWALDQSFPAPGDGSSASLWLNSIQRTGKSQTPAITQPKVRFRSDVLPNRVDQIGDGIQKFLKHRLGTIYNGSGGQISINYLATNCTWENKPTASELDSNTKRCFPSYYTPAGSTTPQLEFFNKWVVDNVVETDGTGGAPDKLTSYTYSGGGAWRYDEGSMLRAKYRTWNQWRGYERVTTRVGHSSENPTSTETLYMRGMHGDRKVGGGTRSVTVTDDVAPDLTDHDYFNGFVRRTSTKLGSGADNVEHEINTPWSSDPTATGGGEARVVAVAKSDTKSPVSTGGTRITRVTNTYNNDGLITTSEDLGDTSVATDDRCTKTSYAVNNAANISALVSQVVTTAGDCDTAPSGANDVISAERYIYDGGAVGSSPTKGDVTQALSASGWSSGIQYQVDQTRTYDDYGRVKSESDAAGKTATTAYSPTSGPADSVTTTNALGQSSITTLDRLRGVPTRTKDAANRITDVTYDALGRTTAVWKPGRAKATQTATAKYTYTDSDTAPGVIKTERLNATDEYVASFEIFDGLLRPRSTQSRAAGVGGGRLITETEYDSRGWVASERGPFYNSSVPSGNLVTAADNATPTMTAYEYDLAGRTTRELTKSFGDDLWDQRTAYDADRVRVTPPAGDTATTTFSDARGQTTSLVEHRASAPTGPGETTTYAYTKRGELKTITNQAGSKWEKSYDIRGRLITDVDPDKGSSTFTYDSLDRQVTSTDARGVTLWTQYDALGREVKTRDDNASGTLRTSRVYDTVVPGMATSSTRHTAAGDYTSSVIGYDASGRPTGTKLMLPSTETALYKAAGYVTNLTYNVDGSVKTVQLPSTTGLPSETLQYGYDALGNQTQLAGYSSIVPETILSPFGEVLQRTFKSALQKGVYETRDYQVGTRRLERRMGSLEGSGTTAILDQRYSYDPAGNVKTLNDIAPGDTTGAGADSFRQCFTYDHLRRMTQAWTSATTNCAAPTKETLGEKDSYWDSYEFDSAGNRTQWEKVRGSGPNQTSTTFQSNYPAATAAHPHALSSVTAIGDQTGTESFEYDQTGNTTSRSASANTTQTYEWDREGRVKSVVHEGSAESAEYVYDANGNRLIARDSASNSTTLFAGMVEVKATGSAVTSTRHYTLGGEKVATRISGSINFLITDHQGTPQVSVLGSSQQVTKRRFSPYGDPLAEPASWPSDKGFLGKTTDRALGTTHLEAREYDTALGRFLTVDPVIDPMDPQQLNGYAYANNSPVTMMDPDGLWPGWAKPSWGGIKGAASGAFRTVVFDYKACSGMSWGCAFEVASATPWTKAAKVGKFMLKANPRTAVFTKNFSPKPAPKAPVANRTFRKVQDTPKSRKAPDPAPKAKPDTEAPKTAKASACSFAGATTVLMADGSRKPIRKVRIGDKVLATDPANGRKVVRKVLTVFKHRDAVVDLKLSSGSVLTTTPDHPFWNESEGEFQRADALSQSDELLTPKGGAVTAVGLQRSTVRWAEAYNLEIDDVHTYFVGEDEVLVHNQNTCDVGSGGAKRGPKPFGEGLHNVKIKEVADSVTDGRVVGGGQRFGQKESVVDTTGGLKSSRRPDVTVRRPDGSRYGINVGKQSRRSGAPIKREAEALNDLEEYGGWEMYFVPYN
ncbi:RHS repeat-associated core domain-containing protein [Aeromicrobium sp. P5_D10]